MIAILPSYRSPETLFISDKLPCHHLSIKSHPIQSLLNRINRTGWIENVYVREKNLKQLNRYKGKNGAYKNDFDENQFLKWVQCLEENTAICDMECEGVGMGVFVRPGKTIPKGTFIASSGVIQFNPTKEELETKVHCSALQDLNSPDKAIMGFIDPGIYGGMLDLINHAPDEEKLVNFKFKNPSVKAIVSTSNLRSRIKFYNGYSIMGLEATKDINGGEKGTQLLWDYASPYEYVSNNIFSLNNQSILLFDNRRDHNGEVIDASQYDLKNITLFIDNDGLHLKKWMTRTRWELMEMSPQSNVMVTTDDPFILKHLITIQASISYGFLQSYLNENTTAERIIIKLVGLDDNE